MPFLLFKWTVCEEKCTFPVKSKTKRHLMIQCSPVRHHNNSKMALKIVIFTKSVFIAGQLFCLHDILSCFCRSVHPNRVSFPPIYGSKFFNIACLLIRSLIQYLCFPKAAKCTRKPKCKPTLNVMKHLCTFDS